MLYWYHVHDPSLNGQGRSGRCLLLSGYLFRRLNPLLCLGWRALVLSLGRLVILGMCRAVAMLIAYPVMSAGLAFFAIRELLDKGL